MKTRVFCDSGAPSIFHQYARQKKDNARYMGTFLKDRKHDKYDWLDNPDYLKYRDDYIQYIKRHEHELELYTNLDIVNNPKATWDNQLYLESHGLKPLPVWHFGTDEKWLRHYIDKGYDYIGIGGMIPNPYNILRPALDDIFSKIICGPDGLPRVKIHGFAATSIPLMCRYPWYSVDSSTWIKTAAFGQIVVPRKVSGKFIFTDIPHKIEITYRSPRRKQKGRHLDNVGPAIREYIMEYVAMQGFEWGESEYEGDKEIIVKRGLINTPHIRCQLNMLYYAGLRDSLPQWPWPFKHKKTHSLGLL